LQRHISLQPLLELRVPGSQLVLPLELLEVQRQVPQRPAKLGLFEMLVVDKFLPWQDYFLCFSPFNWDHIMDRRAIEDNFPYFMAIYNRCDPIPVRFMKEAILLVELYIN
jgi:hypothetical protein